MNRIEAQLWRDADRELDRLLDLPDGERAGHLEQLPGPLRARVQRLLRAHEGPGPLDHCLSFSGETAESHDVIPDAVRRVGPWSTTGVIGRGGMAVVYAAQRDLSGGVQHAALKMLTTAALAGEGRQRFLREHQALARLAHPRIAALLDAGVLPDGTPYLAMQRVQGERIDAWCTVHALDARAVVGLFLQVCDAVAYANRLLVVHRDLKPSNLLVDAQGEVRLLDFGIARLLDEALDPSATGTTLRALTPQYAAPEQFDGSDAGTAVDVYGLGAGLYRLLTGCPPRADALRPREPVPLPSRMAKAAPDAQTPYRRSLQRSLRGDLDAILCRALEVDPEQRYPDAAALAADLRRWIRQRPVQASAPRPLYLLSRFVARHRGAVLAGALLAIAVGAGIAATWWQSARTAREAARAEQVKRFLVELLQSASPEGPDGRSEDTADVLARGAHRAELALDSDPRLQAELLVLIGRLQAELGRFDAADATLDSAERALATQAASDSLRAELAMARAQSQSASGRPAAMLATLEQARALQPQGDGPAGLRLASMLRLRLAYAMAQLDDHAGAGRELDHAEAFAARVRPADPGLQGEVHFYRGLVASSRNADEEALQHLQRALDAHARSERRDEAVEASVMAAMAGVAGRTGRSAEAIALGREVLAITRRLYPPMHPIIAGKLGLLANQLTNAGKLAEAEPLSREALEIGRRTMAPGSVRLASMIYNYAMMLYDLGQAAAALPLLDEARGIAEQGYGPDDFRTLLVVSGQVYARLETGQHDAAGRMATELEHRLRAIHAQQGSIPARHGAALARLARAWIDLGQPVHALSLLELPHEEAPGSDAELDRQALGLLASMELGDAERAAGSAERIRGILAKRATGSPGRATANAHVAHGLHALRMGDTATARADLQAATAEFDGGVVPSRTQRLLDALQAGLDR